jgi:hypothetical protein
MRLHRSKNIIDILMESPLYLTLSVEERSALIARLAECYPFLVEDDDEEMDIGYYAD